MFCQDKISCSPQSQKCRSSGLGEENCKIYDNLCFTLEFISFVFVFSLTEGGADYELASYQGKLLILEEASIGVTNMPWESDQVSLVLTPTGHDPEDCYYTSFLICKMRNGIYS